MVIELESGRKTEGEIRRQYGIKGAVTIAGWLRRYGKRPMRTPLKVASSKKKAPESQERLSQENRELKTALAQVSMEKVLLESLIVEAEERLGVDLRKNFGMRR